MILKRLGQCHKPSLIESGRFFYNFAPGTALLGLRLEILYRLVAGQKV